MATWNATSSSSSPSAASSPTSTRRTEAPRRWPSSESPPRKMRSIAEIMAVTAPVVDQAQDGGNVTVTSGDVVDRYGDVACEKCGSGERGDELLLCDICDRGFHMRCLRPIVVRVPIGQWLCVDCSDPLPVRCMCSFSFFFFVKVTNFILSKKKIKVTIFRVFLYSTVCGG